MNKKEFEIIFVGDIQLELENSNVQIDEKKLNSIEEIWEENLKNNPQLKNNKVLTLTNYEKFNNKCVIKSQFVEFKNALADTILNLV